MTFQKGYIPWNKGLDWKPSSAFEKGNVPWNKGVRVRLNPEGEIKKGQHLSPQTEFKKGNQPKNWKGEKVSYIGLHAWVRRKLGKPHKCEHCGKLDGLQWANKSHKYFRDLSDWLSLCRKCHRKYDGQVGKAWGERIKATYA